MTIHVRTSFASVGLAPIFRSQTHSLAPRLHPAHISLPVHDTGSNPQSMLELVLGLGPRLDWIIKSSQKYGHFCTDLNILCSIIVESQNLNSV